MVPICIHGLSCEECIVSTGLPEGGRELWLGAIGPFRVARDFEREDRLRFTGPIHPAIVRHFNTVLAMDDGDPYLDNSSPSFRLPSP